MGPSSTRASTQQRYQHVVVMRHGDRADNSEPRWVQTAARPWDPPLDEDGKVRAFCTGRKLRGQLPFRIDRVFVSPFLRCVQTAAEVAAALCAVDEDPNAMTRDGVAIDPSNLKVSIEYGLCEVLTSRVIGVASAPKNGDFDFNLSELEAVLPAGIVDHTVERVYKELPQWEETAIGARTRYEQIIQALANKYPLENLLLVTHGEGVGVSVSSFMSDKMVYSVDYCACAHLRRPIFCKDQSFTAGNFEVITDLQTGIRYMSTNDETTKV